MGFNVGIKQVTPKSIIKEQAKILYADTNNTIIMKLENYDKELRPIKNFQDKINAKLAQIDKNLVTESPKTGLISGNTLVDELYLTSISTPKYKYRIFFIEYNIVPYPVNIILDADIAEETQSEVETTITNEKDFIDFFAKVVNSKKVTDVINSLLSFE